MLLTVIEKVEEIIALLQDGDLKTWVWTVVILMIIYYGIRLAHLFFVPKGKWTKGGGEEK